MSSEQSESSKSFKSKARKLSTPAKNSLTLVPSLSLKQSRILNIAAEIQEKSAKDAKALVFMAKPFIQTTLPHRDPGRVEEWIRRNGKITLSIRPGFGDEPLTGERICYGVPYGTIPRLLLIWMSTETLFTKSRYLDLGKSLYAFMQKLGFSITSRGKRSDTVRLKDQLQRLVNSIISVDQNVMVNGEVYKRFMYMPIAQNGLLEWLPRNGNIPQATKEKLEGNWIYLSEPFFECLTSSSIPLDNRIVGEIKQSPLALDLYAWMVHRTYGLGIGDSDRQKASFVSWEQLHNQFGANYKETSNFKKKVKPILKQIKALSLNLHLEEVDGGLSIEKRDSRIRLIK